MSIDMYDRASSCYSVRARLLEDALDRVEEAAARTGRMPVVVQV